jgi:PleD family two-component response regulator
MADSSRKVQLIVITPNPYRGTIGAMDTPKRVLIVEDDAHIAELLRMHLRDEGYAMHMPPTAMPACANWSAAAGTRWSST